MIVVKAETNASGSFRISRQFWGNNLYGMRSEITNSPPAANNSQREIFVVDQTGLNWMITPKNSDCDTYIDKNL